MDAGTATLSTQKGRLRQQLLNGEQNIDALNQPMNPQQPYSNYDIMTPVNAPGPGGSGSFTSRKGGASSITSQSTMNRFFRRNKNEMGGFDEDLGADIGELTNGSNMSFDDLSHIRDRGPYATKASNSLDSTPFIPTLGSNNVKHVNNISYRKQMNQQKKLALVNGARAMSLASGSNPMNPPAPHPQQQGQYYNPQQYPYQGQPQPYIDPRSMSLSSNQNNYRAQSLNTNQPPGAPRTMSLNTNRMFPPQQPPHIHPQQGNPRAMSMRPFPPPNQQFHPPYNPQQGPPPPNGPRTMSLNSNQPYGPHPQQFQPIPPPNNAYYANGGAGGHPPPPNGYANGPRTKSLSSQQAYQPQMIPPPPQQQQYQHQHQHQQPPQQYAYGIPQQQQPQPQLQPQQHQSHPSQELNQQPQPPIQPPTIANNGYGQHNSNESLMHVVEEDEESIDHPIEESTRVISTSGRKPPPPPATTTTATSEYNQSLPLSSSSPIRSDGDEEEDIDEEDAIYKFEPEDEAQSLSRKSTLKKSNSMRLRKINLFSKNTTNSESIDPHAGNTTTPPDESEINFPHEQSHHNFQQHQEHISPSFNLNKSNINNEDEGVRESIYDEQEVMAHNQNHREQFSKLGASALNNTTKDVFVTASDLSPEKRQITPSKEKNLPKLPTDEDDDTDIERDEDTIINKENISQDTADNVDEDEDDEDPQQHQSTSTDDSNVLKERGSPSSSKANLSINSQTSTPSLTQKTWLKAVPHKSLIANTAFSNFRSPSSDSHGKFNNPNPAVLPLENESEVNEEQYGNGKEVVNDEPQTEEEAVYEKEDLNDLPSPQVESPDTQAFAVPPSIYSSSYSTIPPESPSTQTHDESKEQVPENEDDEEEEEEEEEVSHESSNKSVNDNIGSSTPPTASTSNVSNNNYWNIPHYNPGLNYNQTAPVDGNDNDFDDDIDFSPVQTPQPDIQPREIQPPIPQPIVYDAPSQVLNNAKIRSTNTNELMSSPIKDPLPVPNQKSINNNNNSTVSTPNRRNSNSNTANDKDKRSSRTFSLSGSSKNLFKRLSLSGKKSNNNIAEDGNNRRNSSLTSPNVTPKQPSTRRVSSSTSAYNSPAQAPIQPYQPSPQKPVEEKKKVKFTKEELGIMNCNNELLYELELVTTELASSIKRELGLENRLKNNSSSPVQEDYLHSELMSKSKMISELQEKLNKERRLRFVSEEHALLMEHGQNPSPLKLNYEKTELYKQLLIKNDLVHQLEDKLNEEYNKNQQYQYQIQQEQRQIEGGGGQRNSDSNLLDKYNELLKENTDLKFRVIPELEKSVEYNQNELLKLSTNTHGNRKISLLHEEYNNGNSNGKKYSNGNNNANEESIEQIHTLKNQREELRDTVTKMTMNHNYELKLYQDRIKALESKLKDTKFINDKLSGRSIDQQQQSHNEGGFNNMPKSYSSNFESIKTGGGGKLSGFSIVTPTKKFID
ncbi:hypothetical protein DFJ63DRAFT_311306 [Scheffersomyces coipomensis]|uniref:uncharacterized protein n=1 Tax=Scheffersomyces coipomensis TaxID=1788519 RepID=UPI00315D2596